MKKDGYSVSVIIPNFNRKGDLERLLPSIADQSYDDYEVIIVDDFSPDRAAVEYISDFIRDHKNMRLVENKENIGFVKTCNKGIKLASSTYVCILTNDTEVARNFIQRNVEIMDGDSSIGVLSCTVVDRDGKTWFSGGSLKGWIPARLTDDFQGVRDVDYVAGTACFYRREIFEKVGLLNEDLVMYHEDVEFCLRVRNKTEYRTCMFAEKLVTHNIGSNTLFTGRVVYYLHRNLILILRRYSPESIPKVLLIFLREVLNLILISLLRLRPSHILLIPSIASGTVVGLVKDWNDSTTYPNVDSSKKKLQ